MSKTAVFMALFVLAGCSGKEGVMSQQPVQTLTIKGDYQKKAACVFNKVREQEYTGAHKTDLPTEGQIIVSLEAGYSKYWELTFSSAGAEGTRVQVSAAQTLVGPFPTKAAIEAVRSCDF